MLSRGRMWKSQVGQDRWVAEIVYGGSKGGYFVDIGANDGVWLSNTYVLEKTFGWTGLLVEADERFFTSLRENRSAALAPVCLDAKPGFIEFYRPSKRMGCGGIVDRDTDAQPHVMEMRRNDGDLFDVVKIQTVTIDTVFKQYEVPDVIDYLSIDVEGAEHRIFQGFDFSRYRIKTMTVERPKPPLKALLNRNGYAVVGQIKTDTLYIHADFFDPAEVTARTAPYAAKFVSPRPAPKR
jgi:FkbM family methyltransferase